MISALASLFLDTITIDALPLHEQPVAAFARTMLSGLPVQIYEDETAGKIGGDCGNLICVPSSFNPSLPAIALLAHMDTPRTTASVRPIVSDMKIMSDGTTALGVDNRAGFSVLLYVLRDYLKSKNPGNFIVVFTVAEEAGMYGSKHLDLRPYNVKMCFVFDCSKRPGTFIQSAVGCSLYTATFTGRSSHAGVLPEKGVNAIRIAAKAVGSIPMGRLSPTMTSNVGNIEGGVATNVVPDRCTIHGEVREFDARVIDDHLNYLESTFRTTAEEHKGGLEFESLVDFSPFKLESDSPAVRLVSDVLIRIGLTPDPIEYLGGSDANMLNGMGYPSVNLGIGAQNPHGNDEFILLQDLHKTAELAVELIARSASLS